MKIGPLAGVTAFAGIGLLLTGCAGAPTDGPSAPGPEGLQKAGTFSVCNSSSNYPPMYYADGRDTVGFDIDFAQAIADEWGVELELNRVAFDGLIPALDAGRCDALLSALFINDERSQVADAIPYMQTGPEIAVASGNPLQIAQADDLSGRRVAVQSASGQEAALRDLNDDLQQRDLDAIDIQVYPDVQSTVAAVLNGKADAFAEAAISLAAIIGHNSDALQVVPGVFPAASLVGVYVAKNSPLKAPLEAAVTEMVQSGALREIAQEFGVNPDSITQTLQ